MRKPLQGGNYPFNAWYSVTPLKNVSHPANMSLYT